jgi:glycosyltransferase involved in cell wall biosynthesis
MIRIVQVAPSAPDYPTQATTEQLLRWNDSRFNIERYALGPEFLHAVRAVRNLRRVVASDTILHVFGERALATATLVGGKIVYSPIGFPDRQAIRWLRAVMSYREVHIACPTDTMRRALVEAGVPIERCHLIRPAVEFGKIRGRRNRELRAKLRLTDEDTVLLAPGELTRSAAPDRAVWAASILHVLDPKHKLLIWGRGGQVEKLHHFEDRVGQKDMLIDAERRLRDRVPFETLMGVADVVLVTAQAPVDTLAISVCMAAGLPIVAAVSPTVAELLEDRHTALMLGDPTPRKLAQRVLDLRENPQLQWEIADKARTEAYEFFSLTRFLSQYAVLFDAVANSKPVEFPQQPAGAGLRFHGRA